MADYEFCSECYRKVLPRFYVFWGKTMCDDYIKQFKLGTYMEMQAKAWMTTFLFK